MPSTSALLRVGATVLFAAGTASAAYSIEDTFDTSNFFDEFTFFSAGDPTEGFVDYVSSSVANSSGLAGYSDGGVYMGVDYTTMNPSGGRESVRVSSNKAYTHGLFIADIEHMPGGICGVWPAWWLFGPNWPSSGEIDIIEGVNSQTTDSITLHTSAGCSMSGSGSLSSSDLLHADCNDNNANTGCGFSTEDDSNYGKGFNAAGGGVYAMQWTSDIIAVWFFGRGSIPSDINSGSPDPSSWGTPVASFSGSGCDIDSHFQENNIVFDTTFCGDWAGQVWGSDSTCSALASTCNDYVASNPSAFKDAYWLVNSVKVYQESNNSTSTRRALSNRRVTRQVLY